MTTEKPVNELTQQAVDSVLLEGDLSHLKADQRIAYYRNVCQSLGLNPLTKPFDYLTLSGKTVLYARKDCTEQLRHTRSISITIVAREVVDGCYVVTARASTPTSRTDESIGAVPIDGLKGEARSNAMMKAETKAKRRVTLSICGLGMLDETEVDSIQGARREPVMVTTPLTDVVDSLTGAVLTAPIPPTDLPLGTVLLTGVSAAPTRKPNITKWTVGCSDGRILTTIKEYFGGLAEQICQEQVPAYVETRETKWGVDLIGLTRWKVVDTSRTDSEPPPPLTDVDSPF